MADGKQQRQSAETAKWAAASQSAKREGLLAKAKERIDKVDVGDDKVHDQKEADVKKKALDFVSNECLTLPEDRFFKLIDAIEVRMKQKEAYKQNLLDEFRKARKEIADSIAADGKTVGENSGISAEASYVPKKLDSDKGPTILSYLTTIISNDFDPSKFNAMYDMPMLEAMEKYPEIGKQFYAQLLKNNDHLAGFLTYWKPWHPALAALEKKGMFRAISKITEAEAQLRTEFWVPRNSDLWNGNPKEQFKLVRNRIIDWKTGDSYNKTMNVAGDILGVDRKIFTNRFASNPIGMPESGYTKYVKRSANYLEYAVSAGSAGKREFMEQIQSSTEIATGFIMDWNENNQIYQALKLRGKENVAVEISRWKNETMKHCGIQVGTNVPTNRENVKSCVRFALNRTDEGKMADRMTAAKDSFGATKDFNLIRSARYLNFATAYGNEKEWTSFVAVLKSNKKQFAHFIWNWNENSPLGAEIKRNNGASAIEKLNKLQNQTKHDFGMPENFGNVTAQTAIPMVEKYLEVGGEDAKKRAELEENIETRYPEYLQYVGAAFNEMKQEVLDNKGAMLEKTKARLIKFSNDTLLPIHENAQKLLRNFTGPDGKQYMHPLHQKIAALRVAIEAMNTMKVNDTGEEWYASLKGAAMSDANKTWIAAKEQQVNRILVGGDLGAVTGFEADMWGIVRIQKPRTQAELDAEIRSKEISQVDSEAFYQALCQANVLGQLTLERLTARWGEARLLKIALHWGIVSGGKAGQEFNKSWAYRKLAKDRPNVATVFEGVLRTAVKNRENDLKRIDMENADLKSVKDCLKKMKSGITETETEAVMTKMKDAAPDRRLRVLEELKDGAELTENEITEFFTGLSKIKGHEAARIKKDMESNGVGDVEIQNVPEFTTLIAKASDAFARNKSPEDMALVKLLTNEAFRNVLKAENPSGKTPRLRKVSEIKSEDAMKIAIAVEKHLPEGSKLREYFKLHKTRTAAVRDKEVNGSIGASAKAGVQLMKDQKTLPPAVAKKKTESFNNGHANIAEVGVLIDARKQSGITDAPLSKEEKKIVTQAAESLKEAKKQGYDVTPGENSAIIQDWGNESKIRSVEVFTKYLENVAEGKIPLTKEQTETRKNVREEPRSSVSGSSGESHAGHNYSGVLGNASSVDTFTDSKPGEKIQIGNAVTAIKTEGGWLEITVGTRKLRFSSSEAEGAVQQIDLLKEAGAEFLIPAMNEIALASNTRIKDGVGREESARILSVLSRAFGFDSVTKETDPKLMLEKFKTVASGASGDGGIGAKARSLGILDPANNSLKSDVLVKIMGGASTETEAETESAAKA